MGAALRRPGGAEGGGVMRLRDALNGPDREAIKVQALHRFIELGGGRFVSAAYPWRKGQGRGRTPGAVKQMWPRRVLILAAAGVCCIRGLAVPTGVDCEALARALGDMVKGDDGIREMLTRYEGSREHAALRDTAMAWIAEDQPPQQIDGAIAELFWRQRAARRDAERAGAEAAEETVAVRRAAQAVLHLGERLSSDFAFPPQRVTDAEGIDAAFAALRDIMATGERERSEDKGEARKEWLAREIQRMVNDELAHPHGDAGIGDWEVAFLRGGR